MSRNTGTGMHPNSISINVKKCPLTLGLSKQHHEKCRHLGHCAFGLYWQRSVIVLWDTFRRLTLLHKGQVSLSLAGLPQKQISSVRDGWQSKATRRFLLGGLRVLLSLILINSQAWEAQYTFKNKSVMLLVFLDISTFSGLFVDSLMTSSKLAWSVNWKSTALV